MLSNINGYKTKEEWFLGKGTYGSVYKAEKDGKFYAIKIFQTEFLKSEYGKDRLDREIKAIQKISHPNVVKLYEYGTFKDKEFEYFYIIMDLIEGKTLIDYIGVVEEDRCVEIIKSILNTLDTVHKNGILHRDLKPDNVKVNHEGTPIILDFGLAKLIDYSSITQTGERVGTYYYMSPEQITDSKNINALSDYFAVGVIFYQLLTGVLPYNATNLPALIDQIKNRYPKNPSELNSNISNQIENVVLKLLEKEPYKRFQTVNDIIEALSAEPEERERKLDLSIRNYIRLLHTEKTVFEKALENKLVDRIIFPANFFKFYHLTVKILRESQISFTTDPATNRLVYSAFSKTKGVLELPYSSGSEVMPIQKKDFHSISQVQEYIKKVIDYQIKNGVTELAAPFFFAKNSNDDWFNINLKLLKEAIDYRDEYHEEMPIWGGICMNVENWHDDEEKTRILNYYVKTAPDGFFVYGDPIGSQSNLTQLYHYSDLLLKLQTNASVPVISCRINGLGLILLCLGLSGICSGIGSLDSFRESILSDTQDGYSADPRYYIPELLGMISLKKRVTTKLMDIANSSVGSELNCNCPYCGGIDSGTISQQNIKLHFLHRRKEEIEEIVSLDANNRLTFIESKVKKALEYRKILSQEKVDIGNFSYLNTWLDLIRQFRKQNS